MKNWKKEIAKFDKIIRNNNIIYNHKKVWFKMGIDDLDENNINKLWKKEKRKNTTLFNFIKPQIMNWINCKICGKKFGLEHSSNHKKRTMEYCSIGCFQNAETLCR